MCHACAVSNHISISVRVLVRLRMAGGDMGWPAGLAARPCTFLPVWVSGEGVVAWFAAKITFPRRRG